jgi:acetyl/propionyl-CoA carboxylase alpha subunit
VEVQVLADGLGNTVHLLERDCSIQRRYQKIIEETPSPALTPKLRRRMGEAAVTMARSAGYLNAGTVEFLLDSENGQFYFLEMNTRLQVEHPITEQVLGLDLVEWQVRIASGEELTISQDDIQARGHAVECRIYAEDPNHNFVPSAGTLVKWLPPSGPGLRLDSGVAQGQEISIHYDPMLAKLIAWGPDRSSSLRRMDLALSQFPVLGLVTNIPFLRQVIRRPRFLEGDYDTGFLTGDSGVGRPELSQDALYLARALAAWAAHEGPGHGPRIQTGPAEAQNNPWRTAGRLRLP